jgi:hypothetical protein
MVADVIGREAEVEKNVYIVVAKTAIADIGDNVV